MAVKANPQDLRDPLAPPRASGTPEQQANDQQNWMFRLYNYIVTDGRMADRITRAEKIQTAVAAIEKLDTTATLADVITKINDIIEAAQVPDLDA